MQTPQVFLVTGPWASGKTLASVFTASHFNNNIPIKITSDRTGLESAAIHDYGYDPNLGETRSPVFCEVNEWGPPGQIQFTMNDGFALQIVREEMVQHMKNHLQSGEGILLAEVAVGPNVKRTEDDCGILFQTTEHLIGLMEAANISAEGKVHFIQLNADMETRLERQGKREDPTAREAFTRFAGSGGELVRYTGDSQLTQRLENLGCRVSLIENGSGTNLSGLAEALGVSQISPEIAFTTYAQLLDSSSLVRIPPTKFESHPLRLSSLEGNLPKSKELR
jgi:hypothetical protein